MSVLTAALTIIGRDTGPVYQCTAIDHSASKTRFVFPYTTRTVDTVHVRVLPRMQCPIAVWTPSPEGPGLSRELSPEVESRCKARCEKAAGAETW